MAKNGINALNKAVLWLVAVGSLNWLLVALAEFDIVETISTALSMPGAATLLYTLIGAAGAWMGILVLMGKVKITR